jgi:Tol biopolymer transport system component
LARERYLASSPDGSERAIVQADGERDLEIKVYSNTYGTTRQITNFNGATSYDPAWSPRGDWIAFVSTAYDGDEIYLVDPQGTTVQRLTYNAWEWDKHPAWSPDGSQIVFYSNRNTGHRQLWIMNADGSNQRNLSNDEFENWDPVWVR